MAKKGSELRESLRTVNVVNLEMAKRVEKVKRVGENMKKTLLVLVAMVGLLIISLGCAHPVKNISKVQKDFQNWDMHIFSDTVQKEDSTIYYFYAYYGEGYRNYGWYGWEYVCDKDGGILKTKEYWIGNDKAFEEFRKNLK